MASPALSSKNWGDIASSSDGAKLAAVVPNGFIYTSADSGATWTTQTGSGSRMWKGGIACSSDVSNWRQQWVLMAFFTFPRTVAQRGRSRTHMCKIPLTHCITIKHQQTRIMPFNQSLSKILFVLRNRKRETCMPH